ncbi:MAG TPA: hypothetical protein VF319_10085 [Caldimonas sp.]
MAKSIQSPAYGPVHVGRIVALPTSRLSTPAELYTVPAGMRLVIEYVSFACTAKVHDDHAVVRLRIGSTLRGESVWHDVNTLSGSNDWSGASQLVRIYADPQTVVHALVDRVFRPPSTARISFSGQLERLSPVRPGRKLSQL